ncbi:hypothetical protein ONS96_003839 [Cadophora gregata f. sp. sojae]|nr:hypothetical protein ONS96_003839 [Cadophora gregata f. sp. sojae]
MHSFGKYIQAKLPNVVTQGSEPFFRDEAICELGQSWENACFGGQVDHLYIRDKTNISEPSLGQIIIPWPSWYHFGQGQVTSRVRLRYKYHEKYPVGTMTMMWVMPMFFLQNIQQVSLWATQVSKYGTDALKSEHIIGHRLSKGGKNNGLVWGRDARVDVVARRFFPKREGVPIGDRQNDFLAAIITARQKAAADNVNAALQQQSMLTNIKAGVQPEVDQEELDQQMELVNKILTGENCSPEVDNSGLLDELSISRYLEVRILASLAIVRDMRVEASRRKHLCNAVRVNARALAGQEDSDGKWIAFERVAIAELKNIRRQQLNKLKRRREDDQPVSSSSLRKVKPEIT